MTKYVTTLEQIRCKHPCKEGWSKLLGYLKKTQADDEPLMFTTILDAVGVDDTLWCTQVLDERHHRDLRLFAVWCALQAGEPAPDTPEFKALEVAKQAAEGGLSEYKLGMARSALDLRRGSDQCRAVAHACCDAHWVAAWLAADSALMSDPERTRWAQIEADQEDRLLQLFLNGSWPE